MARCLMLVCSECRADWAEDHECLAVEAAHFASVVAAAIEEDRVRARMAVLDIRTKGNEDDSAVWADPDGESHRFVSEYAALDAIGYPQEASRSAVEAYRAAIRSTPAARQPDTETPHARIGVCGHEWTCPPIACPQCQPQPDTALTVEQAIHDACVVNIGHALTCYRAALNTQEADRE